MSFVVDASVFVAAAIPTDIYHIDSQRFLKRIERDNDSMYCPTIVLCECASAIARPTRDSAMAIGMTTLLLSNTNLTVVEITKQRAHDAAGIAANCFLRGADSLYVQVAQEYAASLITWDGEMLQRAPALVATMTPKDWLAANP